MSDSLERRLLAQLFLDWVEERTGERPAAAAQIDAGVLCTSVGGKRMAVAIEAANSGDSLASWTSAVESFEHRLDSGNNGAVLAWLPAGAELPAAEPKASEAAALVQQAIDRLAPGEMTDARLPIAIGIRKRDEAGAYVSAYGGLAPLWAQFTDRVQGYYQIDSMELHRLPGDEVYIRDLIDRIVEASNGLELNESASVETEDSWRVQRLLGGEGCALVGLPPSDQTESGAPLRKRLRAVLRESRERLALADAELRVLVLYGHYASIEDEPIGPALRGQDPALFGGLDMVALIADGAVKPLIDISRQSTFQPRPRN